MKRIISLALSLVTVMSLAACGSKTSGSDNSAAASGGSGDGKVYKITSVSYTHLDVYKRQGPSSPGRGNCRQAPTVLAGRQQKSSGIQIPEPRSPKPG